MTMDKYNENDMQTAKEQHIFDELKAGNYTSEKDFSSGGFYMVDNWEPGFNRVQLWYEEDGCKSSGTELEVTVNVAGVTFTYDPVNEEWSCNDLGEISDELIDWLNDNIDTDAGDIDDQLAIQMRTLDDAKSMLLDYPYFEINGDLYYYIDDDDDDELDDIEDDGSAEYQLLLEKKEMKDSAVSLTEDEAAQMLLDGNFEWRDF